MIWTATWTWPCGWPTSPTTISLPRFGAADLQVTAKPDLTPVSDADLAVETAIRERIGRERPDDVVVGEEFGGSDRPTGGRRWIVDPIDGTKNFVRGVPVWATLIALFDPDSNTDSNIRQQYRQQDRRPGRRRGVGAGAGPALVGEGRDRSVHPVRRWTGPAVPGVRGEPARRMRRISYSEPAEWRAAGRLEQFRALLDGCWRTRAYGDFYSYMLLAEGAVDIATEPELSLWDVAALVPIVVEAGGRFTAIDGQPSGGTVRSALATNGLLHSQVVTLLNA